MVGEDCAADSSVSLDGGTIHVIATSFEGTREALEAATALARGLSGHVVVFVRRVAPDVHSRGRALDIDSAEVKLRRLIDSYAPRPQVLACVYEEAIDVVPLFQRPGLVVIGGETRWWWPTADQRLARALTRLGCHVTFVHVPHSEFVLPLEPRAKTGATVPATVKRVACADDDGR